MADLPDFSAGGTLVAQKPDFASGGEPVDAPDFSAGGELVKPYGKDNPPPGALAMPLPSKPNRWLPEGEARAADMQRGIEHGSVPLTNAPAGSSILDKILQSPLAESLIDNPVTRAYASGGTSMAEGANEFLDRLLLQPAQYGLRKAGVDNTLSDAFREKAIAPLVANNAQLSPGPDAGFGDQALHMGVSLVPQLAGALVGGAETKGAEVASKIPEFAQGLRSLIEQGVKSPTVRAAATAGAQQSGSQAAEMDAAGQPVSNARLGDMFLGNTAGNMLPLGHSLPWLARLLTAPASGAGGQYLSNLASGHEGTPQDYAMAALMALGLGAATPGHAAAKPESAKAVPSADVPAAPDAKPPAAAPEAAPPANAAADAMRAAGFAPEHVEALKRSVEEGAAKPAEPQAPEATDHPILQLGENGKPIAPEAAEASVAEKAEPVEVSTKALTDVLSADDPRAAVRSRARELFAGRTYQTADGARILVPWQGIRHGTSGTRDAENLAAMMHLDDLIESSRLVRSEPDKDGRASIVAVHQYEAPVSIDGAPTTARIFVRELSDGSRYYDHTVIGNSEPSGMPGGATREGRWPVQPAEGSKPNLPEPTDPHTTTDTAGLAREGADAAYAAIAAALFKTYGNDFELNSGAAGSGADWKFTLSRPSTGMTHALQVIFPGTDPAPGQVLAVDTFSGDVITLKWVTTSAGTDKIVCDTTSIAFGSTSPVSMFTLPASAIVKRVAVVIDTAFNGTPSLSVGVSGTTSKYLASTQVDLTASAGTVFEVDPGQSANGSSEALIATYAAGSASAGAARILVDYVIPS